MDAQAFDRSLRMLCARCIAQALRRDGAHGRQRVLDAMVQLFQDQLLQLVGGFAFLGVDAMMGTLRGKAGLGLLSGLFVLATL